MIKFSSKNEMIKLHLKREENDKIVYFPQNKCGASKIL